MNEDYELRSLERRSVGDGGISSLSKIIRHRVRLGDSDHMEANFTKPPRISIHDTGEKDEDGDPITVSAQLVTYQVYKGSALARVHLYCGFYIRRAGVAGDKFELLEILEHCAISKRINNFCVMAPEKSSELWVKLDLIGAGIENGIHVQQSIKVSMDVIEEGEEA